MSEFRSYSKKVNLDYPLNKKVNLLNKKVNSESALKSQHNTLLPIYHLGPKKNRYLDIKIKSRQRK